MTALIITLISIALVVLLAGIGMFYGGSAFTDNNDKAVAARIVNEGQQIRGAVDVFRVEQGSTPDSLEQLVDRSYLKAKPASSWAPQSDYVVVSGLTAAQCKEANRLVGVTGVPSCTDSAIAGKTVCCEAAASTGN